MPMIDIYVIAGTFVGIHKFVTDAVALIERRERVPGHPDVPEKYGRLRS